MQSVLIWQLHKIGTTEAQGEEDHTRYPGINNKRQYLPKAQTFGRYHSNIIHFHWLSNKYK